MCTKRGRAYYFVINCKQNGKAREGVSFVLDRPSQNSHSQNCTVEHNICNMVYQLVQSKRLFCVTKTNKELFGFHNIIFLLIDLKERALNCMSQSIKYLYKNKKNYFMV